MVAQFIFSDAALTIVAAVHLHAVRDKAFARTNGNPYSTLRYNMQSLKALAGAETEGERMC